MEIAVNGIDGAGKSTFIGELERIFRQKGISVAVIDFPYFRRTQGFSRISPLLEQAGNCAERTSRILFGGYAFAVALSYWWARWRAREAEVCLVEHHPRVDLVPYAAIYGGRIGVRLARLLCRLWPEPAGVVLLAAPPEEAMRRIHRRGRAKQWRQTASRLGALQELMAATAKEHPCRIYGEGVTAEEAAMLIEREL